MQAKAIRFFVMLCVLAALGASGAAAAQAWPAKPVRVIVNFPPGGAADVIARAIAPGLGDSLAQPVLIENRPGANGNIGAEAVVRAGGDGYTLLMASGGTVSVNPQIYSKMTFDPVKDLQPVAAAARVLVYLVVRPDVPANNVAELVAHMRRNPGRLSFGSPGSGSSPHLAMEMFKMHAKVFAVHVGGRPGAHRPAGWPAGTHVRSWSRPHARALGQAAPARGGQPEAFAAVPEHAHAG